MTLEEQAASVSLDEIVSLLRDHGDSTKQIATLTTRNGELQQQLDWFKRQLFGTKADRRIIPENHRQLALGESLHPRDAAAPAPETTVQSHQRKKRNTSPDGETKLRFDASVPVEVIEVPNLEVNEHDYDVVGEKVTDRLAQRPGAYVVLRYLRKVYKKKRSGEFSCAPPPGPVFDKSFADVSLLAGLVIDKYRYHLPLYRQHQRLEATGVHIGRSTLTSFVQRVADLLSRSI